MGWVQGHEEIHEWASSDVGRRTFEVVEQVAGTRGNLVGEAEFYGAIKGACEGLGIKSLLADLGFHVRVEVIQDSTAAKGTASRAGIGRIKHLDVGWCWIQQIVESGEIKLMKIDGKVNPADFRTKPKNAKENATAVGGLELRHADEEEHPRRR